MAEAVAEQTICEKCGVEVREGSAFCYNCGSHVAAVAENGAGPAPVRAISADRGSSGSRELRPARQRRRRPERKPVEVYWERPETTPWSFTLAVVCTAVVVAVLLVLAWILR